MIEHTFFSDLAFKMKSAGFVECKQGSDGKIHHRVYGESKGLGIKHNPADSELMDVFFNPSVMLAPKPPEEPFLILEPTSSLCN